DAAAEGSRVTLHLRSIQAAPVSIVCRTRTKRSAVIHIGIIHRGIGRASVQASPAALIAVRRIATGTVAIVALNKTAAARLHGNLRRNPTRGRPASVQAAPAWIITGVAVVTTG